MFARLYNCVSNYFWPKQFTLETSFHYSWNADGIKVNQYRNCVPCESIDHLEKMYKIVYECIKFIDNIEYFIQVKGTWRGKPINQVFPDIKQYHDFLERVIATAILDEFGFINSNSASSYFTKEEQELILRKVDDLTFCSQIHGFYQRQFSANMPHIITPVVSDKLLALIKREIPELNAKAEDRLYNCKLGSE